MGSGASGTLAKAKPGINSEPEVSTGTSESSASAPSRATSFKQATLELTFVDQTAEERAVRFSSRPLGFEVSLGVVPIRVDNVYGRGLAFQNGVEMGWYLRKVNGLDVSGKPFQQQFNILKQALAKLPVSEEHHARPTLQSLEIVFEAGSDPELKKEVPVVFSKKPLGFEFEMLLPITVKYIQEDCVAKRHGVEVGWVIKKVGGVSLQDKHLNEQVEILKHGVFSLPDVTYCIAPPLGHSLGGSNEIPSKRATDGMQEDASDGRL